MFIRLAAAVLILAAMPANAQTGVLSGTVTDAQTGEALVGARVAAADAGAATDSAGAFRLALPTGAAQIVVSYVGYARDTLAATVPGRLDVALAPQAALAGALVTDTAPEAVRPERLVQMGRTAVGGADVRTLPAFLGEADVLRTVQLLPGVRAGQEGGLYVRGGSPDQTLVLLDGVPVYNPAHLFGFLSTFNGDALSHAELSTGAFPARYGGRLGAVLDVTSRDGDPERFHAQGQVGLLSTRALVEGPLWPRASFLVSGRRTYLNLLADPLVDRANKRAAERGDVQVQPRVSFFDLNARLAWQPTSRDRLGVGFYGGGDTFGFETLDPVEQCAPGMGCRPTGATDLYGGGLDWGNRLAQARYTRTVSSRVLATAALSQSDYGLDVALDIDEDRGGADPRTAAARYRSDIRDRRALVDVSVAAGRHAVRAGASATQYRFTPGALSLVGEEQGAAIDTLLGSNRTDATELALYAEDEARWGPLGLNLGLRLARYAAGRNVYPSVEPRVSASLKIVGNVAVKASAARTQQPIHLLTTGAGVGLPADLWVPADSVGPQRGWQGVAGFAGSFHGGRTTWTLEAYRRAMRGLVAYRDGASFTTAFSDWQDLVVVGQGTSRGLEALVRHRSDRLTAWAAYTLSRTDRQFDALDGGQPFPYRYDRRHEVTAVAAVRLSGRLDVSAAAIYGTGDAVTLPTSTYDLTAFTYPDPDYWAFSEPNALTTTAYGPRNRYRLPAYVRLDLGATFFFRRGDRPHALALNVYNATNRKNPFLTTYETQPNAEGVARQQLVGVALFPILPSLSYQVGF